MRNAGSGSVTVVGSGIKPGLQTTPEARRCIEHAGKLLYLFTDPVPAGWIRGINPTAESLERFYTVGKDRRETYDEMVEEILSWVRRGFEVCVVFYGHPGVFVAPSHEVIRRARHEGFAARMLPAISAEDCLFADVGVDPGAWGCQTFEATNFLLFERSVDVCTPLILWQITGVGSRGAVVEPSSGGLTVLAEFLQERYGPDHEVVLYLASPYPLFDPFVERVRLRDLATTRVPPMATLFVPPLRVPAPDPKMAARLGVSSPSPRRSDHRSARVAGLSGP